MTFREEREAMRRGAMNHPQRSGVFFAQDDCRLSPLCMLSSTTTNLLPNRPTRTCFQQLHPGKEMRAWTSALVLACALMSAEERRQHSREADAHRQQTLRRDDAAQSHAD